MATGLREGMADIARQGLLQTQEAKLETRNKKKQSVHRNTKGNFFPGK